MIVEEKEMDRERGNTTQRCVIALLTYHRAFGDMLHIVLKSFFLAERLARDQTREAVTLVQKMRGPACHSGGGVRQHWSPRDQTREAVSLVQKCGGSLSRWGGGLPTEVKWHRFARDQTREAVTLLQKLRGCSSVTVGGLQTARDQTREAVIVEYKLWCEGNQWGRQFRQHKFVSSSVRVLGSQAW